MQTLSQIFWQIFPVVLTLAVPTLTVIATSLARRLGAKLDVEKKEKIHSFIVSIVSQGVTYAEQLAKKNQDQITSQNKLFLATKYIITELERNGILTVTAEEIQEKIESILGIQTINDNNVIGSLLLQEEEEEGEEDV